MVWKEEKIRLRSTIFFQKLWKEWQEMWEIVDRIQRWSLLDETPSYDKGPYFMAFFSRSTYMLWIPLPWSCFWFSKLTQQKKLTKLFLQRTWLSFGLWISGPVGVGLVRKFSPIMKNFKINIKRLVFNSLASVQMESIQDAKDFPKKGKEGTFPLFYDRLKWNDLWKINTLPRLLIFDKNGKFVKTLRGFFAQKQKKELEDFFKSVPLH